MRFNFVKESGNARLGGMPMVYATRDTCPPTCPLMGDGGCYGENFPMKLHWDRLDEGMTGMDWDGMLKMVEALPANELWRYGVVGDLPHKHGTIDSYKLEQLMVANRGKRGFAYTHHATRWSPAAGDTHNAFHIDEANQDGFTVNISANTISEAEKWFSLGFPTTVLLHESRTKNFKTPEGTRINICPKAQRKDVTCKSCGLCQWADRDYVIGFPAHGTRKKKVNAVAVGDVVRKIEKSYGN